MDAKELNTKSYEKNSKYHRHTGKRVRYTQKSRCDEDKQRDHRKIIKKAYKNNRKNKIEKDMKNDNFNCQSKLMKSKPLVLY